MLHILRSEIPNKSGISREIKKKKFVVCCVMTAKTNVAAASNLDVNGGWTRLE